MCALLVSVITLSGAANRSFRTEMEQWNPIGFPQASNGMTQSQAGAQTTNLTAGNVILPTVATAAPSGVLRGGSTNVITFTTVKEVGEKITLYMKYSGAAPTLSGATGTPKSGKKVTYTLKSQTVTIQGDVTVFLDSDNQLTTLDVSKNTALKGLACSGNQIKGEEMTRLVNSLPDYTGKDAGRFIVVQEPALEGNICLKSDVAIAKSKNWNTQKYKTDTEEYVAYEGAANVITFTTAKAVGETVIFQMNYTGAAPTLSGATGTPKSGKWITYTLTSQTVTITGDVTDFTCQNNQLTTLDVSQNTALESLWCTDNQLTTLDVSQNIALTGLYCYNNQLTALDVSKNTALTVLDCYNNQLTALDVSQNTSLIWFSCTGNQIKGEEMTRLVNSLPDLRWKNGGEFTVVQEPDLEGNICLKSDVAIAKGKNWNTLKYNSDIEEYVAYEGEEPIPYAVTLTKEGEGTLTATGAADLTAVPEGIELTIEATPAEGYELTALTANGTDILATKKFTVRANTEVKAIFAKTYAVTLTNKGEGTLTATGADNLNAVPEGTELTIEATPAEGYELKALTANGTDILATKKFTVTADTEVKATFTKKTYAVTLTKEGEGTLTATGADDLNAVPYGTELTIEATPAAGYELKALTANGADILATKKVVVTAATTVKATFTKKTYAVTLTKEGEGTLTATGAADLNAVAYGTELTIVATPTEGYELTALTANGADILATKKFTVRANTEVKATFTKKTAADVVESGALRLYPNPASAYVNVKGAKANALVRLYDANGTLRYEARTDADGTLQIDLSGYAEGIYLLRVGDDAQRLLIQR